MSFNEAQRAQSSMPRTGSWWNGPGKRESVILTRSRGDAEEEAEKRRREREDERGDSGGWWPSVRSGIHALRGRAGDRGRRSPRFD